MVIWRWLWRKLRPGPCNHQQDYRRIIYTHDSTVMVIFECHDCGFRDHGPVDGVAASDILVMKGKRIFDAKFSRRAE